MRQICFVLLLFVLPALGGCYSGHPRYQPFSLFSAQGYEDIAIDDRTYLVLYRGYHEGFFYSWDTLDEKWLQGAQEYALYRAGELAKSKGAKYFVVLYKDDWNLLSMITGGRGRNPVVHPGAGLVIRVLNTYPSTMKPNDERVYEVDKLLQDLAQKNNGLAVNHKGTPSEEPSGNVFGRWRSSASGYDSVPVPGHWEERSGSRGFMFESGTRTTRGSNGNVQVASSHEGFLWTMPLSLLRDCVLLADEMRFAVFKLRNWTVEEHRDFIWSDRFRSRVWFRTTAEVILQHDKEPDSLDPVFVVDEIRPHVMDYKW